MVDSDRRTYLKATGSAAAALTLAGCTGGGDGGSSSTTGGTTSGSGETAIVAGTAPGFPPFEMVENGDLVGFDIDLLEAVVEQSDGYTLKEWQQYEFDSLTGALTTNKIDVIAAGLSIKEKRKKVMAFSDPYWESNQAILVRKGSSFQPQSLSDLAGHGVGAQSGTTGESQVQDLIDKGTLTDSNYNPYSNYVLAVTDLENGNIDAVVLDSPVADTFVSQRDVVVSTVVETGEQYAFGLRKGSDSLVSGLNGGLQAVKNNGTYADLKTKWFASATTTTTTTGGDNSSE
ncbi:basic amino acid ABC transporter substrate-binding protein [Halarchaeum acidiphilum]|uniref:basic amino acid ABC transporter substrate-binding protein n=1 Tax=Halarchaeum acidiphilum TaxID=489138 RepID=UPI00036CD4A6|nr:basic amino acid ABC transporter substrate-binding protein [Halarchaeum acidiphilum]